MTDALVRCVYRTFRRFGEARRLLAGALAGVCLGGCSMSFPMESLVPEDEPKATGTLAAKASSALSPELGEEDWRRAKGALAVALDPQGN
ncbi:MAG TPA: hypothetical protein VFE80_12705, partial [Beijerinckiaceae bacterium]|nr:hypothetical protein [Beijerinckiaceae bacterium]